MKKYLMVIMFACTVDEVHAGTGWDLRYDQPEGILEIHSSSLYERTDKQHSGWRKVRTRMTYPHVQVDSSGSTYLSLEMVNMVSCKDRLRRPLSEVRYAGKFGKGEHVGRSNWKNARPIKITPGSTEELILAEANCSLLTGQWATAAK